MKGVIGAVACDEPGCPHSFVMPRIGKPVQANIVQEAAVGEAILAGWSVELRSKESHYCPGHALQRKNAKKDRETKAKMGHQES